MQHRARTRSIPTLSTFSPWLFSRTPNQITEQPLSSLKTLFSFSFLCCWSPSVELFQVNSRTLAFTEGHKAERHTLSAHSALDDDGTGVEPWTDTSPSYNDTDNHVWLSQRWLMAGGIVYLWVKKKNGSSVYTECCRWQENALWLVRVMVSSKVTFVILVFCGPSFRVHNWILRTTDVPLREHLGETLGKINK